MRVRFTPPADRQYLGALRYLLERSPAAAAGLQRRAEAVVAQLSEYPESGHVIPEFPELPHRELPVEPYRFFHRVVGDTVWIVAVWHSRQLPDVPDEPARANKGNSRTPEGRIDQTAHARLLMPHMLDTTPKPEASSVTARVLFVCIENSNRSQMAEAFARMHGGGVIEPASAGSRPSGAVNPRAISAMQECGYDLTRHSSKGLDDVGPGSWDWMITMGCGNDCPLVRTAHREDWQLPDPKHLPPERFNEVRDEIERRVEALIERIRSS